MNLVAYVPMQQRRHRNTGPSDGTAPCLPAVTAPVLGLALMGTLPPASQWRCSDLQQEAPRLPAICARGTGGSQRPPFLAHLVSPFSVSFLSTSERAAEIPLSPGPPGKGRRVMRQNLHHSGSNFPLFVAKNKTCTCSLLPLGFLLGFRWEPLAPWFPLPCCLPLGRHGDSHNLGIWVALMLLTPPPPGQGPQGPHEEVPLLLCSSKQPCRWAGALACMGTPTPFANITAAEKRQAPLEGFLCAACFFLISGMHRGKRDKLICSINFVNIDCAEVSCQSHVRDPRTNQKPAGHRLFLGAAYPLGGGRKI